MSSTSAEPSSHYYMYYQSSLRLSVSHLPLHGYSLARDRSHDHMMIVVISCIPIASDLSLTHIHTHTHTDYRNGIQLHSSIERKVLLQCTCDSLDERTTLLEKLEETIKEVS